MTVINSIKSHAWQTSLVNAITDPQELLAILELDPNLYAGALAASQLFALKVPREFVSRMEKGNINDPLLRQVLPLGAESQKISGYSKDPLAEAQFNPIPGLLQKFQGRVLLTLAGTCSINCRYCFRRHFPYAENNPGKMGWAKTLDYINQDDSISEVILSGGDPLVLNDALLESFINKLTAIKHVKRLRIHSRIPIVLPERITDDFLNTLSKAKQKVIMVVHCNHPNEINHLVKKSLKALGSRGITLLNQFVLLKDINDNVNTLVKLSEDLFDAGVLPYYLLLLDKVEGAAHFDVELETARQLYSELNTKLPGYLMPRLVFDQPGAPAKVSALSDFFTQAKI